MPSEVSLLSAFLIGLLGSTHCIAMCGGIVGALTMGLPADVRQRPWRLLPYLLAYNSGRITSYMVAGLIAGALGMQVAHYFSPENARLFGRVFSALFMVALGLYLAGWWRGLTVLEKGGAKIWQRIQPLGRRFLPVKGPGEAAAVGLLWGWLPCGMVYSVLAWAFVAGSASQGGLIMIAFGLGTLPTLLAIGAAAKWLGAMARTSWVRQLAGVIIILFGTYSLVAPPRHGGHQMPIAPSVSGAPAADHAGPSMPQMHHHQN